MGEQNTLHKKPNCINCKRLIYSCIGIYPYSKHWCGEYSDSDKYYDFTNKRHDLTNEK